MLATLEGSLPLGKAIRQFFPPSRTGNPVHLSTALRWIHKGVVGPDGERVHLPAIKIGGVYYVRPSDVDSFLFALNTGSPAAQDHADADMARRGKEAVKTLEALGC